MVTVEIDKIRWLGDWSVLIAGSVTRADELVGEYEREFSGAPFTGPVYDLIERAKKPAQRQKKKAYRGASCSDARHLLWRFS